MSQPAIKPVVHPHASADGCSTHWRRTSADVPLLWKSAHAAVHHSSCALSGGGPSLAGGPIWLDHRRRGLLPRRVWGSSDRLRRERGYRRLHAGRNRQMPRGCRRKGAGDRHCHRRRAQHDHRLLHAWHTSEGSRPLNSPALEVSANFEAYISDKRCAPEGEMRRGVGHDGTRGSTLPRVRSSVRGGGECSFTNGDCEGASCRGIAAGVLLRR